MTARTSALAAAVLLAGAALSGSAVAAPLDGTLKLSPAAQLPVEKAQFYYEGREYCWYPDGWHGPGWYWCGYPWRRGFGWGGVYGWNGWVRPGYGRHFYGGPRHNFYHYRGHPRRH